MKEQQRKMVHSRKGRWRGCKGCQGKGKNKHRDSMGKVPEKPGWNALFTYTYRTQFVILSLCIHKYTLEVMFRKYIRDNIWYNGQEQ